MIDCPLTIMVSPLINGEAWRTLWKSQSFLNWDDAEAWLNDRYQARVNRLDAGFVIRFPDIESQTQFSLEWLS